MYLYHNLLLLACTYLLLHLCCFRLSFPAICSCLRNIVLRLYTIRNSDYETKKLAISISILDVDIAVQRKDRNLTSEKVCDILCSLDLYGDNNNYVESDEVL
jgi:hypothetical protein